MPIRIYVAGPYRADTPQGVTRNVHRASNAGAELLARGYVPMVPHSMTHGWEHRSDLTDEMFLQSDLVWLRLCDAVLVLPDHENSAGTLGEIAEAERLEIPVFYTRHELYSAMPPEGN